MVYGSQLLGVPGQCAFRWRVYPAAAEVQCAQPPAALGAPDAGGACGIGLTRGPPDSMHALQAPRRVGHHYGCGEALEVESGKG